MKTNLLAYDHALAGSTNILVEVPESPVQITLLDYPGARVGVRLATAQRNMVQVGPDGLRGTGVKVRALDAHGPQTSAMRVGKTSFSQVSVSGGSVIQCAGSMRMGLDRSPGLNLLVPRGSFLDMRAHGPVKVYKDDRTMTLEDAFSEGLIDVKFQNEL